MSAECEISRAKKALRKAMLELRRAMPFAQRAEADSVIRQTVLNLPAYAAAEQVFAYVSMPHEVGTRELLAACLLAGKTVGLPVCDPISHTMTFYRLDDLSELRAGAYRIPIPPTADDRILQPTPNTLMLVPMLAFDAEGFRLGAGGGYYDRFLAANAVTAVGLCYADCRLEQLPHEPFDCPVACCITEQNTEDFYGKVQKAQS